MNEKIFVGIDPGASGAVAVVTESGHVEVSPWESKADARDFLESWCCDGNHLFAVLEDVHTMPKQGIVSAGKFLQNKGIWEGLLCALRIPNEEASPRKWQAALGLKKTKEETKTERKKRLKDAAQGLFPNEKLTLRTADALLIAEYCRRTRGQL